MVMRSDKSAQPPLAGDRSTMKAKFRAQGVDGDNPSPLSFRDMLMDTQGHSVNVSFGRQDDWELEEEDVTFREENVMFREEELMPYIAFSSPIRDRLVEPWEHSVVVKTLGRNLGYCALSFRLNKKWTPDFDVVNNKIDRIMAWIHLSEMNIHFYHKNKVEYENLPTICFGYGKFGHYKDACPDSADITHVAKDDKLSLTEADKHAIVVTEDLDCQKPKFGSWIVVARKPRPRKVTYKETPKAMDKNQNRSGITQSRFSVLDDLANEDMHPHDYDDDSVSQREPIISIPENTQTLGPKSRSMKKKLTNPPIRKLSTRKATNLILPSQPTTENLDPNIQIFSKYSHPNSQPPTVHGMHANHEPFSTPVPCIKSNAPSTSMHGMHSPNQSNSNTTAPVPVPVPTTLNSLHHNAVSFPEETTVELEESPVTSRSRSPLAANDCSVGAENGMEVEAEVISTKYRVDRHNLPRVLPTRYGSHLWKSLGHVWSEVLASRRWSLGDGKSVRF
ncbi:hypothetical protein CUMW_183540 [Citrus unshiu]|uniref:DUF4283 domain-containing protein n=1 Tax=Citrus unshiu TaxID=55188 RepID=A0A2H5Q025_CITUN|nr:hypothetical protein CUMW_183540 [Citrus unshiu]